MKPNVTVMMNPEMTTLSDDDLTRLPPEVVNVAVVKALLDFKIEKANGVLEIHFAGGSVANIFAKVTRRYK